MIREKLIEEFNKYSKSMPQDVNHAIKCIQYIKCLFCLDTQRVICTRNAPTFLGYDPYMIRTCGCTGSSTDIQCTTHLNHYYNNRLIPCNANQRKTTPIDHIKMLAELYRKEFKPIEDKATADKAAADKIAADKAAADKIAADKAAADKAVADKAAADKIAADKAAADKAADEAKKKLFEDVDKMMNDGSDKPIHGNTIEKKYNSRTETTRINIELGNMIKQVINGLEAYSGDIGSLLDLIKDLKLDLTISSGEEKSSQNKCISIRNNMGQYVYLFLYTSATREDSSCSLLEWCGCISSMSTINVHYTIFFPKNNKAKENCENKISTISENLLNRI
jgi:hypothetical protein